MKPISCLMLDMGGVLTQEHRLDKVDAMVRVLCPGLPREVFLKAYYGERDDYDRGTIDGGEYWRRVAASQGAPWREAALPELMQLDVESWFNMRKGMLAFLEEVRGRVGRLVLLSNINEGCVRYVREGDGREWASLFDELVLSCEHRLLKPQREIYELALDRAGARASETLFVDDNQPNVEGALAAGLSSFRFVDEADFFARMSSEFSLTAVSIGA
jgi:putative hydrolase of the HAD superfamily